MKPVGQQFVFEMNLRGVGVGESVDGRSKSRGQEARAPEATIPTHRPSRWLGRPKAPRFSMPVPGQIVVAWVEDFVEHVVHGLHEVVP